MRILMMVLFVLILTACGGSGGNVTPPMGSTPTFTAYVSTPQGFHYEWVIVWLYQSGQPTQWQALADSGDGRAVLHPDPGTYDVLLEWPEANLKRYVDRGVVINTGAYFTRWYEIDV